MGEPYLLKPKEAGVQADPSPSADEGACFDATESDSPGDSQMFVHSLGAIKQVHHTVILVSSRKPRQAAQDKAHLKPGFRPISGEATLRCRGFQQSSLNSSEEKISLI